LRRLTCHSREQAMSNLRRYHTAGNWYFITNVTYLRRPVLVEHADLLLSAFERCRERVAHDLHAWVILPDHFHAVINSKDGDMSGIMQRIKMGFAAHLRLRTGNRRGRVWQNRFWDHVIRDEEDLNRHIDYIHYNPVKHELASSPFEWKHSSIHQFHLEGIYDQDWGRRDAPQFDGNFGE